MFVPDPEGLGDPCGSKNVSPGKLSSWVCAFTFEITCDCF